MVETGRFVHVLRNVNIPIIINKLVLFPFYELGIGQNIWRPIVPTRVVNSENTEISKVSLSRVSSSSVTRWCLNRPVYLYVRGTRRCSSAAHEAVIITVAEPLLRGCKNGGMAQV